MACATTLFENFATASTFNQILTNFYQMCNELQLDPLQDYHQFYANLKSKVTCWKVQKLWELLDKRAAQKEYKKQKACENLRVLIIGAGPCGLRMAIECAFLGCKAVVVEKRGKFSRNNVLHVWPFVIQDLRNLGAKYFYPKFCAGSIDHISIRQLQCILLKVALILGVEIHENVTFLELIEPEVDDNGQKIGWRAQVSPERHYISEYEFDALIGADGQRNTLPGFPHKEFRGKLALAITANFINRRTEPEERVQEIPGVAFIFNQQFFHEMRQETAIDLENIVYYKDETHYFVMTAKKRSLLERKVIRNDYDDVSALLHPDNVDQSALMAYASEAADFATEGKLPTLDFAVNHNGLPDVAMFDFTSLFSAENSCRIFERKQCRLLVGIVGDSLHEPFWPTGSGAARGFLSVFDAAWMLKMYWSTKLPILEMLAQRESVYRLLAQTTTENLNKNLHDYSIDPKSRYPQLEYSIFPDQVTSLVDTDNWDTLDESPNNIAQSEFIQRTIPNSAGASTNPYRRSALKYSTANYLRQQHLIRWYQQIVQPFRLRVDNLTLSFRSGAVLSAVLYQFMPDRAVTADFLKFKTSADTRDNLGKVFEFIKSHLGIDPPVSLCDKNVMFEYLYGIYNLFKCQTPKITSLSTAGSYLSNTLSKRAAAAAASSSKTGPAGTDDDLPVKKSAREIQDDKNGSKKTGYRKNSGEQNRVRPRILSNSSDEQLNLGKNAGSDSEYQQKFSERHRLRLQHLMSGQSRNTGMSRDDDPADLIMQKSIKRVQKFSQKRLKEFEQMLKESEVFGWSTRHRENTRKKSKPCLKTRKLDKKEIEEMEEKLKTTAMGCLIAKNKPVEPNLSSQDAKIIAEKTHALKQRAQNGFREDANGKYESFDKNLQNLDRHLRLPNLCGATGVQSLLQTHTDNIAVRLAAKKKAPVPLPDNAKVKSSPSPTTPVKKSPAVDFIETSDPSTPLCYFCSKRVYLAEKLTIDGLSCHKTCFKCAYCQALLRIDAYRLERLDIVGDCIHFSRQFFCLQHAALNLTEKLSKIRQQQQPKKIYDSVDSHKSPLSSDTVDYSVLKPAPVNVTTNMLFVNQLERQKDDNIGHFSTNASIKKSFTTTPERAVFEVGFRPHKLSLSGTHPEKSKISSDRKQKIAGGNNESESESEYEDEQEEDEEEQEIDEDILIMHNLGISLDDEELLLNDDDDEDSNDDGDGAESETGHMLKYES